MAEQAKPPRFETTVIVCFLVALTAYLVLFFRASSDRAEALLVAFVPDQVLLAWIGGDLSRVGIMDRAFVLFFAGLHLLLALICGNQTLALLIGQGRLTRIEWGVFSIAVGLSELSLLTLLVGLAGGLQYWLLFWGVFLALAAVKTVVNRWLVHHGSKKPQLAPSSNHDAHHQAEEDRQSLWVPILLGVPFLLLIVLGGMMPPWEFDVREYHLQVPKEWYQAGSVHFLPHNVYGNMPLGAEMHAVLGMVLTAGWADWWWGALVGKTVMACFAPLTALGLFAAVRRHVSAAAGGAAAVIYVSVPWVAHVSMTGLNEAAVGCYALLAVAAMLLWQDGEGRSSSGSRTGYLLLAGLLAGAAAACKYPALLFVVVPLAVWSGLVVRGMLRNVQWHVRLKAVGVFLLAALLVSGPWYAKNLAFTGNPFYPLVFGGATRTPELLARWNRAHQVPPDDQGRRYGLAPAVDSVALLAWRSPWVSPVVLPLAAMAWLGKRHRRHVIQLSLLSLWVLSIWWLATHRIDRFVVPLLPWAAWLAGIGFVWSSWRPWRRVATTVLIAGVAFNFLYLISSGHYDRRLLVSLAELRRDQPAEPGDPSRVSLVHRYLNTAVPEGKRVLLVGDAQPFDLEVPAVYHTCFDPCIFELWMRDRSGPQRLSILQQQQISHVYFDWGEIARYRSPGNYGFSDWVTPDLVWRELVHQQGILRNVPLDMEAARGELFEVIQPETPLP
jgi:hypothetical protein